MKRTTHLLVASAFVLAGCSADSPLPTDHHAHAGGLMLSDLTAGEQQSVARRTSPVHSLLPRYHERDCRGLHDFQAPAADRRGRLHFGREPWCGWNGLSLHQRRRQKTRRRCGRAARSGVLVYAPKNGPSNHGDVRRRLAAVEYFIPFSAKFPGTDDTEHFKQAPRLHDFPTMSQLPDVEFTEIKAFGGWMFHIWVWENNPDGIFSNFNSAVPLCG